VVKNLILKLLKKIAISHMIFLRVGLFFGSVRNIAYKVKKYTGVSILPQTIEKAEQRM